VDAVSFQASDNRTELVTELLRKNVYRLFVKNLGRYLQAECSAIEPEGRWLFHSEPEAALYLLWRVSDDFSVAGFAPRNSFTG
jgi:hypothetical protein